MFGRIIKYLGRNVMEGREAFFSGQDYVVVFMPKPFITSQDIGNNESSWLYVPLLSKGRSGDAAI